MDFSDHDKIGSTRQTSKAKAENRRRMGRKVVIQGLRTADSEAEVYAVVTKMFGNGMCEVQCVDGEKRMCIMRKKFRRGPAKRQNMVGLGVTILVGLRDWEHNERSAMEKCDLLEVYSSSEVRKLKQMGGISFENITYKGIETENDDITFDTSNTGTVVDGPDDVSAQPDRYRDLSDDDGDSDVDVDDI
jgi:initiation factor 1A